MEKEDREVASHLETPFKFLTEILVKATRSIKEEYFRLPVASDKNPVVMTRERVYCYELYHQLRLLWPKRESFPYALHGEVDKSRHPFMEKLMGTKIPDFIIHIPGSYDKQSNLTVIEVKPCGAKKGKVKKDLETLTDFVGKAKYFAGINLIYGGTEGELTSHLKRGFGKYLSYRNQLHVYWHSDQGKSAQLYPWWERV